MSRVIVRNSNISFIEPEPKPVSPLLMRKFSICFLAAAAGVP